QAASSREPEGARGTPQGVEAAPCADEARLLEALRRAREPGERRLRPGFPRGQERRRSSARQPLKVLITDHDFPDVELEKALFREAGIEVAVAQCRTEDEVIEAGKGCAGFLTQYTPMNARVFAALPELRIVSRFGAGFDTVNTADAKEFGVWVANAPDYGVGEVATHALGMSLALLRHLPWFDREIRAGRWHYAGTGPLARVGNLTLGILGFGRIGKRMAHISRSVFGRVIACDPYVGDGDFFPDNVVRVD